MGATHRIGFVIVVLVLASVSQAAERHVPDQYATIQAAINAAATGDVVIIAPGTYTGSGNRDISFKGKAITVRSISPGDPAVVAATVVDCQATSAARRRGFKFITNEGPNSVLSGLTIRNGFGPNEDWEGSANSAGGAIYISSVSGTTSPTIRNCVIENCQGDYWGGGIYAWKSNAVIEDCTFRNCQQAGGMGGAIYCNANGLTIMRCTFSGNSAAYGGALYCLSNTPVLANCLLVGNTAAVAGGAMRMKNCTTPRVTHCTFSGNQGGGLGGAVHATGCSGIVIGNSILWADTAMNGPEAALDGTCTMSVSYSDLQGGEASVYVEPGSTLIWDSGNIDSDPLFVDADGPDNNPTTWQDNDYHLSIGSPCVNTADPAFVPADGETDIDGEPRVQHSRVDMGADEIDFVPRVQNLTQAIWYPTIQQALNAANNGDEIVANPGTYSENIAINKPLLLRSIYPMDPAIVAATIIEAPQATAAVYVSSSGIATLDGFAITHRSGVAGDGIRCLSGSFVRCVIRDNQGCGIRVLSEPGWLYATDCTISGNSDGGVHCSRDTRSEIICCTIAGNATTGQGGGICFYTCLQVAVQDCLIVSNTADQGGGIYCKDSFLTVRNCTIVGNTAVTGGGLSGLAVSYMDDYTRLYNSIVRGNIATSGNGPQIALAGAPQRDTLSVSFTDVEGSQASVYVAAGSWLLDWGPGNIDADPLFVDADGSDDDPATWQDNDYHLQPTSPCINTGSNALAAIFTDTTTADGTTTTIVVANASKYSVDDELEYSGDHVMRTVTAVDSATNTVTFDQGLAKWSSISEVISNYGWGDIEGNDRVLLGTVDMGAYEATRFNRVHNVKQDKWYTYIQDAIDDAYDGDAIVAKPDIYVENIQFGAKEVQLQSVDPNDPAVVAATILDGGRRGPVITFSGSEGPETLLSGLTITHGHALDVGGIRGNGCVASITHCIITANAAGQDDMGRGGGIRDCNGLISQCMITGNSAVGRGGGLYNCGGLITDCQITNNSTSWSQSDGGGLYGCNGTIRNCRITGNRTYWWGGGIAFGSGTLIDCVISGNTVSGIGGGGGGVSKYSGRIVNCLITDNTNRSRLGEYGGGLYSCSGPIANSTVANNTTLSNESLTPGDSYGGGLDRCTGPISNCIIWGNKVNDVLDQISGSSTPVHSCVQDWTGGGTGNIASDPLFLNADGLDEDPATWQDNNYRLQSASPCLNVGNNALAALFTDYTVAAGTPTMVVVIDASRYSIDDEIEYDDDGVLRTVVAVDVLARTVTFDQALLAAPQVGKLVRNYGWGDLDGHDRVLFGTVDMGAYEWSLPGDANGDGYVDVVDLLGVVYAFGTSVGDTTYDAACDFNGDGYVDVVDLLDLVYNFGT